MQIKDSTFLISGGASGLGAGTAKHLVGLGAKVVLADLNEKLGNSYAAELGANARFARADVGSEADCNAAIALAQSAFGGVHGVVNCAGVGTPNKVLGKQGPLALAEFARVININLVGSFNLLRLAAAAMAAQSPNGEGERGVIINTASVAAFDGQIGQPAYAASKAGVVGMTLPIAREFARYGIRVMTIAPGLFETPMMAALPQEAQDALGKSVPFPARLGRAREYAVLVQQIVENPMLNGETIRLDGALRMAPK
ncbi:MAG TPA: SDR family NAD(P)-dependent oxidoreductase [Stenotrophobium sp.]|nr:SDR family NAD(P)-dependent oxidoreductase [Stenotrophobium sp.]